jgi:type II secretory pathway component HofQ
MIVSGVFSNLAAKKYNLPLYFKTLVAPLERGDACRKGNYPEKVNLVFEEIALVDSLNLLAGFSCNELRIKDFPKSKIQTNFKEINWVRAVKTICIKNALYCKTKDGVLYAVPFSRLNKHVVQRG